LKLRVSIQPEAEAEIIATVAWYSARLPALGRRFRESLRNCLDRIREHPQAYPRVRGNARRATLHRFPYSVIYLSDRGTIVVVACFHASRDPSDWERRVPDEDTDS
jgi:plasmid stabilization system protein ParE